MATLTQIHFGHKLLTAPAVEPVTTAEAKSHMRVGTTDDDTLIGNLITAVRQHTESLTRRIFVGAIWQYTLDAFPSGREPIVLPKSPLLFLKRVRYVDPNGVTQTWGDAAMEIRVTPANIEVGDVFTIFAAGVSIASFTATTTTLTDTITGLRTAWLASTSDYAIYVVPTNLVTYLELLSANIGEGFAVTTTATNGGATDDQTLTAVVQNDESTLYRVDDASTPARLEPVSSGSYPDTQQSITNAVIIDLAGGYGGAADVPQLAKAAIMMGVADLYENREANVEAKLADNRAYQSMLWSLRLPRVM